MRTKSSISKNISSVKAPYAALSKLWVLRLLKDGIADGSLARNLVMRQFGEDADPDKPDQYMRTISDLLKNAESKRPKIDGVLKDNIDLLGRHFRLTQISKEILAFRAIYRVDTLLEKVLDHVVTGYWNDQMTQHVLSVALGRPKSQIENALAKESNLNASGLVNVSMGMGGSIAAKLIVLQGIVSALTRPANSIYELLSFAITKLGKSKLSSSNYPHHQSDIELIRAHLSTVLKDRAKGTNILIYGDPGVGKTELVKVITSELRLNTLEVTQINESKSEDDQFHPRLRAYQILQKLLSKSKNGMVLFDELEDVLPKPSDNDARHPGKAWFNKLLEENPVPTIWISNHVWQIDPAFMRRFDIIVELRNPPRSVRSEILTEQMSGLPVDPEWIDKKANNSAITPALTSQIAKVIRSANIKDPNKIKYYFDRLINEHHRAIGKPTADSYPAPSDYKLDWLNTSSDIHAVCQGIANKKRGKILLFGPPGCGKTAFAHHLSRIMDRPLMHKRASDLISKWVGDTEANLRDMFREAANDESILLLDEADSFLQNRSYAEKQWEITEVNELLTQMENFEGTFICATNFVTQLDPAAMRRFAFKLKFEYLNTDQIKVIFEQSMKTFDLEVNDINYIHKAGRELIHMKNLTPGDFAATTEHFKLLGIMPTPEQFVQDLKQACTLKGTHGQFAMGFVV